MHRELRGVRYVKQSGNGKTGVVDAVYIAIAQSCLDCPLKPVDDVKHGCWATVGRVGMINLRLEKEAAGLDRRALGREVARAINQSYRKAVPPGRLLRLPVSGDLSTPSAVAPVALAVDRWLAKGGEASWGYTHGWRRVERTTWGAVSVLASVESLPDVKRAHRRGYAAARIVPEFPNGTGAWMEDGFRHIPCPEQTLGIQCAQCKLCMRADKLHERKAVVAFRAHSLIRKRALTVLR